MKKLIIALGLVSILLFAWVVPVSAIELPGNNWATCFVYDFATNVSPGTPQSVNLYMGKNGPSIGIVTIEEISGNLVVTYQTDASYPMSETHLAIASGASTQDAINIIMQGKNNPSPGSFANLATVIGCYGAGDIHSPPVNTYSYQVSLTRFGSATGVVIAAHAVIAINGNPSAWADVRPVQSVPELPAAALLGIGLAGIGTFIFIRRRRSTASTR
jgi:hypothetical protein